MSPAAHRPAPRIAIVGSANIDLVARCVRMPRPGGTFTGAPARDGLELEPDLLVVNRYEYEVVGPRGKLVALTLGAEGAMLLERGRVLARARPPALHTVDGTGAGDAFCAALVVSLLEDRERDEALRRACAAGGLAASRVGAQASLPTAGELDALLAS